MSVDGRGRRRAQVVLVAAAAVALALVPVLLAYLQLGYHDDVGASADYTAPTHDAQRALERAVHDAGETVDGEYGWGRQQRQQAAADVRERLGPRLAALRESRVERGTVYEVSYNETAAETHAREQCPRGEGRRFGPCQADGGVVVQRRAGETHLLAVAFDLAVTTERGRTEVTLVVPAVSG